MMMNDFSELTTNNSKLSSKEIYIFILAVIVFSLFFFFYSKRSINTPENILVEEIDKKEIFKNLELEAKAAMVWDINNQEEIYSHNKEAQLPLASLSKVAMALTAIESAPEGTIIKIKNTDLSEEGDNGLYESETWSLKDLIDFSLVVSSNDGSRAIASAIGSEFNKENGLNRFVEMMNMKSKELGLSQTYFISPSGLDKKDIIAGGSGSAKDMAILFEYIMKYSPQLLEATSYPSIEVSSLDNLSHKAKNTNSLVNKLPGIVASKTGFTDLAGGNLVVVFEPEPNRPIVLIVLGSSLDGRFVDIEKLYLTTLEYINP